jgi:hypothetical protein
MKTFIYRIEEAALVLAVVAIIYGCHVAVTLPTPSIVH